jgi:hypothetical protein
MDPKLEVGFHIPVEDRELLAALGEISLLHGHIDHVMKLLIKTFSELTIQEVMDATARESSWNLREWVKKLARDRLGKGTALAKVLALLERASRITERRNAFVHILCGKDQDGNPAAAAQDLTVWKPLPTVADLDALSADMKTLRLDISRARSKSGFISEALVTKERYVRYQRTHNSMISDWNLRPR